ncbi:MAG: Hpt domain-containing protein, partial [Planctomycetales bacterium]|nr:Hpt domain-containing protein [Planctomycetales bacterium]
MDDELLSEFVVEANEHMADIENQLLSIEESGANVDVDLVNEVFRGVHSIKGAAGFLGMTKVNDLAHSLENILNMMRNRELEPNSEMIDIMLRAADRLQGLLNDISNSNEADVSDHITALESISAGKAGKPAPAPAPPAPAPVAEAATGEAAAEPSPVTDDDEAMNRQIEAAFAAQAAAKLAASQTPAEPQPETHPEPQPEAASSSARQQDAGDKKTAAPE